MQPHRKEQWVIPPHADAAFVAAMEDVLEVYRRPHDPMLPLVCLDEATKQVMKETRTHADAAQAAARRSIMRMRSSISPT